MKILDFWIENLFLLAEIVLKKMIWNCFQKQYYGVNIEFSIDKFNQKFEQFLSNQNNIRTALVQEREKHVESALQSFYELENSLDK